MSPTEVAELLAYLAALDKRTVGDADVMVWHDVIGDMPPADAMAAVRRLARTQSGYIGPADIRREVYREAGLLAPDPEGVFAEITRVASNQGTGRTALGGLGNEIYEAMGGAMAIPDMPRWAARRDFDALWTRKAGQVEADRLAGDFEALTCRSPRALS